MRRYQKVEAFFESKSEAFCNKEMNPRVRSLFIWSNRFAKCRSMAATGTSGIGGGDGRKGGSQGMTLGRSALAGRRL
ncbi:hypothetical protein DPMN_062006 [Dreissena polymorpha]|uniref:Uncharacterized protein n=1 Tax=Dreissena polymorpha TaxID=45954 RepID=A0A9D4C911_DREPO|nr:hypothetical protein DPMN_062006 [Dreissena polymorpha]